MWLSFQTSLLFLACGLQGVAVSIFAVEMDTVSLHPGDVMEPGTV